MFPSHHGGFLGGEHGYAGEPEAFAVTLRDVLDAGSVTGQAAGALQLAATLTLPDPSATSSPARCRRRSVQCCLATVARRRAPVTFGGESHQAVLMLGRVVRLALAAVGLYFVWPSLVEVFGSYDELAAIRPWWFVVMAMLEMASFVCAWLLVGISTSSSHWLLIATAHLVGNAVSSIVPGGAAAGGPLQYSYMVRGGEQPARTASGLVAASLLTTTTLFGLAALCVPLTFRVGNLDARLERAAWLGTGAFVVLLLVGFAAFTTDGLLRTVARGTEWVLNRVRRRRPHTVGLPERLLDERDRLAMRSGHVGRGRSSPW